MWPAAAAYAECSARVALFSIAAVGWPARFAQRDGGPQDTFAYRAHAPEPEAALDSSLLSQWRKRLPNYAADGTASMRGEGWRAWAPG